MLKKLISFILCFNLLITPVIAQDNTSLNSAFSDMNKNQFTDQEMRDAEKFKHQPRTDRLLQEQCTGTKCQSDKADLNASVLGGNIGVAIEQNIGKLYAAIFGAGGMLLSAITSAIGSTGGGAGAGSGVAALGMMTKDDGGLSSFTVVKDSQGNKLKGEAAQKAKDDLKAEGKAKDMRKGKEVEGKTAKTEKQSDYCAKIAIASEVSAAINQHIKQKKIESMPIPAGDEQKGALEKVKLTHDERRVTSIIQATGFTAVASCYGAMMLSKAVVTDTMMVVKMASATTLATIFHLKARKHKKASEEIGRIIASLPKEGACNPYTDTLCFCAEVTSEKAYPAEFSKVCLPSELGPKATASSMSCLVLNKEGKYVADTVCKCKQTNSCFKANLSLINPNFKLASNMMAQGNSALNAITNGNFDEGKLNTAYLNNAAFNNRVLKSVDTKIKPVATNEKNKKLVDELSHVLPPNIASQVAATSGDFVPATAKSSMPTVANISPKAQETLDSIAKKVAYEEGGPGFGGSSNESEDINLPEIPGMGQQNNQSGLEVVTFAEQAVENADITKAPETPIFDIISYRYRQSAWNKVEIKNEETKSTADKP